MCSNLLILKFLSKDVGTHLYFKKLLSILQNFIKVVPGCVYSSAVESRKFEPNLEANLEANLEPNPNRISNFEPIFGFEIRTFEHRCVGSSRRFKKFGFKPTRRIRCSKKFEASTALVYRDMSALWLRDRGWKFHSISSRG